MNKTGNKPYVPFSDELNKKLKSKRWAAAYLAAALEEGDYEYFLKALRNVVEVHGGIGWLAKETGQNRESLYKTLSGKRNPKINTIDNVLNAVGLHLTVKPT